MRQVSHERFRLGGDERVAQIASGTSQITVPASKADLMCASELDECGEMHGVVAP